MEGYLVRSRENEYLDFERAGYSDIKTKAPFKQNSVKGEKKSCLMKNPKMYFTKLQGLEF